MNEAFYGGINFLQPSHTCIIVDNQGVILVVCLFHSVLEVHPEQKKQSESCSSLWAFVIPGKHCFLSE